MGTNTACFDEFGLSKFWYLSNGDLIKPTSDSQESPLKMKYSSANLKKFILGSYLSNDWRQIKKKRVDESKYHHYALLLFQGNTL